jgi:hypothetical protein
MIVVKVAVPKGVKLVVVTGVITRARVVVVKGVKVYVIKGVKTRVKAVIIKVVVVKWVKEVKKNRILIKSIYLVLLWMV